MTASEKLDTKKSAPHGARWIVWMLAALALLTVAAVILVPKSMVWFASEARVAKLTDLNSLADIAENAISSDVREAAFNKLVKHAINYCDPWRGNNGRLDLIEEAIDKLDPQRQQLLYAAVAKKSISEVMCSLAIGNLTDEECLADVAKNCRNDKVRQEAFRKLTDLTLISIVTTNAGVKDESLCLEALEKLAGHHDNLYLIVVAQWAGNKRVCSAALKKLTKQKHIADVAKFASDKDVCLEALNKLTEQKHLVDVVEFARNTDVRAAARKKLEALGQETQ